MGGHVKIWLSLIMGFVEFVEVLVAVLAFQLFVLLGVVAGVLRHLLA